MVSWRINTGCHVRLYYGLNRLFFAKFRQKLKNKLIPWQIRIEFSPEFWYDLGQSLKAMMETSKHRESSSEPGIGESQAWLKCPKSFRSCKLKRQTLSCLSRCARNQPVINDSGLWTMVSWPGVLVRAHWKMGSGVVPRSMIMNLRPCVRKP